jgi:RNA polymerase sigma-70 factor, ECF subfamily
VIVDPLAELARRARAGDASATGELLRALYAVVRKQIHFQIADAALAEDAVQDTMIALHRALPGFRGDSSPRTWAIAIAVRIARRTRQRAARYVVEPDLDLAVFDTDATGAAELALLRELLGALDAKKREAFVLMGIFELTAEEAGRALGTFANTAASRFRHARGELEDLMRRREKTLTTVHGLVPRRTQP